MEWARRNQDIVQLNSTCFLNETASGSFFPRCVVCENTGLLILHHVICSRFWCYQSSNRRKESNFHSRQWFVFIRINWVRFFNSFCCLVPMFSAFVRIKRTVLFWKYHSFHLCNVQNHWSNPYQYSFSTRSFFEMPHNHSQINPVESIVSFHSSFQVIILIVYIALDNTCLWWIHWQNSISTGAMWLYWWCSPSRGYCKWMGWSRND